MPSSRPFHTAQELFTKAVDRHNPGPQPKPQKYPTWHSRFNLLNKSKRRPAESQEPDPTYVVQPPPKIPYPYERPTEATLRGRELAEHLRREQQTRPEPSTPPRHPPSILCDPSHLPLSMLHNHSRPKLRSEKRPHIPMDAPVDPRRSSERKEDPRSGQPDRGAFVTNPPPSMPYIRSKDPPHVHYEIPDPISDKNQRQLYTATQGAREPAIPSTTHTSVYEPPHVVGARRKSPRRRAAQTQPPPCPAVQAPTHPSNHPFQLPTTQGVSTWIPYAQAPLPLSEPHATGDADPFAPSLVWPPPRRVRSIQLAPWLSSSSMARDLRPSVIWDVAESPMSEMCRTEQGIAGSTKDVFSKPAVHPSVNRMVIRCDHLDYFGTAWPWGPIIIESASGITIGEVFWAIFKYFQRQLTNAEVEHVRSRSEESYRRIAGTWEHRCYFRSPGTFEDEQCQGLKRVDCLGQRHMFWSVWTKLNHDRRSWGAQLGLTEKR